MIKYRYFNYKVNGKSRRVWDYIGGIFAIYGELVNHAY